MKLANIDEPILLLVLDQVEFESMRLLLDIIVRLLQLSIQLLVLICAILLLLEDLAVILILIGHVLSFLLQLQKLCILLFNVALRLGDILLELGVEIHEHVLPIEQIFLPVRKHLMVPLNFLCERLSHVCKLPLRGSVRCKELIIENAFHFHLLRVLLVVQVFILLGRVIKVVIICGSFTLEHGLEFIALLHQLLV